MLSVSLTVSAAASCRSRLSRSVRASVSRARAETTVDVMSSELRDTLRTRPSRDSRWIAVSSWAVGTRRRKSPPPSLLTDERAT